MKKFLLYLMSISVCLLLINIEGFAVSLQISGSPNINNFQGVVQQGASTEICTESSEFTDMPGMVSTIPPTLEVLTMFQGAFSHNGDFSSDPQQGGFIRLVRNTKAVETPGPIHIVGSGGQGTHGFNWNSPENNKFPTNPTNFKVQWRTVGGKLCVEGRSLIQLYKK